MGRVVGIDLGTTNSCIAVGDDSSECRVLSNNHGARTTPSVVAITEQDDRLVGQIAKRQAVTNSENTVYAVKRLIGRKLDSPEVQAAQLRLAYGLTAAENGDVLVQIAGNAYSPQEISAVLLREMKRYAEEALGEPVTDAIITVPAYFDDCQRQATKDAGKIAGLDVLRIINEPTAAALAYGMDLGKEKKHIAIYDLGGGTFDISILEISDGIFEVKATHGDPNLGGEDFDHRIMDWLIEIFREETGIDLREDRMALQRLKESSERAKAELSVNEEAEINLPFISADESGPRHLSTKLTRKKFEEMVTDLVERTAESCRDALEQARMVPSDIDEVLLVGGQTRTPLVIEMVEEVFGQPANCDLNPDEVVAVGAAIQGGILHGAVKDVVLLDVTPLSLGIETQGGLFTKLIERNSTIPTRFSQIFTTVEENQDTVKIHVLQGERKIAAENRSLGKIELVGIPPEPRGMPQIEVTFSIDSNSIHTISARDMATDQTQSIQINPVSGLSSHDVERLLHEANEHSKQDRERQEFRRLRNRVEGLVNTNERVFSQFSTLLSSADQNKVRSILRRSRKAVSDPRADLNAALFDLNTVSALLSGVMLETAKQG